MHQTLNDKNIKKLKPISIQSDINLASIDKLLVKKMFVWDILKILNTKIKLM